MGYLKIPNLYKSREVLLFKEVYVMEKIHGTSAHLKLRRNTHLDGAYVTFFSGGEKYEKFISLFDDTQLVRIFDQMGVNELVIFGEAYGGSQQGMSHTYGKDLKFVVFDVKIDGHWLSVPNAEQVAERFGLDFVYYQKVDSEIEMLNEMRDADSVQAQKNGMGIGHKSEGIVIRPLIEVTMNNGERVIAKHKRDDFRETKTPRNIDTEKLKVLEEAQAIADEWVTEMRLAHVIDRINATMASIPNTHEVPELGVEETGFVIKKMIEDIKIEGEGEIVWSKDVERAIGKKTALLYKSRFKI